MKFALTIGAKRNNDKREELGIDPFLTDASNKDEARGKGYLKATQTYPTDEGWSNHFVLIDDGKESNDNERIRVI